MGMKVVLMHQQEMIGILFANLQGFVKIDNGQH